MESCMKNTQCSQFDTNNKEKAKEYHLLVYIRVRPPLKVEFGKELAVNTDSNNNTIAINTKTATLHSTFDRAFDSQSTQLEVFDSIKDYVQAVIQGYNCTVFAYGQTGSGKTHTMFGSDWEAIVNNTQVNRTNLQTTYIHNIGEDTQYSGLIPRMIYQLFKDIESEENKPYKFAVYCCFLQIYNEKIYDLLQDRHGLNALDIRENRTDGIYVEGLTEFCVTNYKDCLMLMQKGERNRFIRSTSSNVKSSRSHTIFQIILESTKADKNGRLQKSKLNLCDLAGSEKLKKSENIEDAHFNELKNINLSLTTLGKVIHTLSLSKPVPIPYRESKLTRLLQDSLGGNTRTCLIATLNPLIENVDESIATLKFAERAQHIVTKVKKNKISAVDTELVNRLQREIEYLRDILNMKRIGHRNDVHEKLLILQEENNRLRQAHLSTQDVEGLIEENKKMKLELQKLRGLSQGFSSGSHSNLDNLMEGFSSQKESIPTLKNFVDSAINLNITEDTPKPVSQRSNLFSRTKNSVDGGVIAKAARQLQMNNEEVLSQRGTVELPQITPIPQIQGRMSEIPQTQGRMSEASSITRTTLNTSGKFTIRIKGKKSPKVVIVIGKSMDKRGAGIPGANPIEVQRLDNRRKEQLRALERLKEIENLTKKQQEKLKGFGFDDKSTTGTSTSAVTRSIVDSSVNLKERRSYNRVTRLNLNYFQRPKSRKILKKDC